ncbi:NVEALA domain-containing protein [Parabacteroides goldsteinii]|uniref:NVEALA domain-containing protein n=1 Tax=Parabacteroides goldsteinii TaxID=328812 RepID=UPI003AEF8DE0
MKKILLLYSILSIFVVATIVVCSSLSKTTSEMSELTLANIEALANGESSEGGKRVVCYNKLQGLQGAPMEDKTWCESCKPRPASEWSKQSECTQK